MDLDNIKKTWNDDKMILPIIAEDKIREIIQHKGKSAIDKLMLFEKIAFIIIFPLIALFFILAKYQSDVVHGINLWLYPIFCVCGLFWQLYKIKLLKSIDIYKADIITCTKNILRYKKCIPIECFASFIISIVIFIAFMYPSINQISYTQGINIIIRTSIILIVGGIIMALVYKLFCYKQIQRIEDSLSEIQELEKNN
jgi:phosphoglycerol transferase MdoB-like AlkP superfamily enzyme